MLLNEWVDHRKGCATCHPKLPLYRSFGWQIWEIWGIWELRVINLSRTEFINTLYFSKRWILLFGSLFKKRTAKIIIIDSKKLKVFCQCWNFHKRNNQAPKNQRVYEAIHLNWIDKKLSYSISDLADYW